MNQIPTTEEEYRAYPAINYSSLAQFNVSQDHALLPVPEKSIFEFGHIFEVILQDAATGSKHFDERYFVADVSGGLPDELTRAIKAGDDLESMIVYTQKGDRSKVYATKHAYIDACLDNPGKFPVGKSDFDICQRLLENMLIMEVFETTVHSILSGAKFQVPIVWESKGWDKKALLDAIVVDEDSDAFPFDIKTTGNPYTLRQMLNQKYWIQDCHYTEGVRENYGNSQPFTFLVAYREEPYLCQAVTIAPENQFKYDNLCQKYGQWIKDGKPPKGYLPEHKHYVFHRGL